jgi:UDP-2,3-diacylglucosamine pyrophosphatase LpxH
MLGFQFTAAGERAAPGGSFPEISLIGAKEHRGGAAGNYPAALVSTRRPSTVTRTPDGDCHREAAPVPSWDRGYREPIETRKVWVLPGVDGMEALATAPAPHMLAVMARRANSFRRGWVISDLHLFAHRLFAHRSAGSDCFRALQPQLASAEILVLNGDIFDFRWSTLPDPAATAERALQWLRELRQTLPDCETHYVLGNHDCPAFFATQLAALTGWGARFHVHAFGVRLGSAIFVHGDCAHRRMDGDGLRRYRVDWDNDRCHGAARAKAYVAADRAGLTRLAHQIWFPRRRTVARVTHYLDRTFPKWREGTRDCYFGHTHLPFSDHREGELLFHNTGSGIRGMGFNPRAFSLNDAAVVSLS